MKFAALSLLTVACFGADERAANYARAIQDAGLDPDACYRVRDLGFQKEDLRFYLNEGHLIFAKPVDGRRLAAMFTAEIPGGDAEVLLFPPSRSERMSLARYTKSPNLNEHFTAAVLLFSDGTGEELLKQIVEQNPKRLPEVGAGLAESLNATLRNFVQSYQIRYVQDRFSADAGKQGFFYAAVRGRTLGNFDLLFDPRSRDQILAGQLAERDGRRYFDIWTSFESRSVRTGRAQPPPRSISLANVRIEATLQPGQLTMQARTVMDVKAVTAGDLVLPLEISRRMKITSAKFDGQSVGLFSQDSLRADLVRGGENALFLVMLPKALETGATHMLEFEHEGNVVSHAGNGVYSVSTRLNWYPGRDAEFARYQMTFRYPKDLRLVATGERQEEKEEGEWKIARYTTSTPIRFAGFNLGRYETVTTKRAGVEIEVHANRSLEAALQPRRDVVLMPQPSIRPGRRPTDIVALPSPAPPAAPNPLRRLDELSTDIGNAVEFLSSHLGPPPLKTLSVSPIPGTFGQGFPGLLYLSTLSYLDPADLPRPVQTGAQRVFFTELLHAHETAHQWWGNLVTSGHYQDDWLMEALAGYSALMVLEKRKGRKAMEQVLTEYAHHLLEKSTGGETVESAGPVVWGSRLQSSLTGDAWRAIVYEKGAWIIHMLRERLGEQAFLRMLGELTKRYRFRALTTDEFRRTAAELLPPGSDDPKLENFFDSWVFGTGIPRFRMDWKLSGKAPKLRVQGIIGMAEVNEEFSASVPVEVQTPGRKALRRWVRVEGAEGSFHADVAARPAKVLLDPGFAVLSRRQ